MRRKSDLHEGSDALGFFRGLGMDTDEAKLVEKQEWLRLLLTEEMRKARRAVGMTQGQVAEKLGVTQGWVSRLEHADNDHTFESVVAYLNAVDADLEFVVSVSSKEARTRSLSTPRPVWYTVDESVSAVHPAASLGDKLEEEVEWTTRAAAGR